MTFTLYMTILWTTSVSSVVMPDFSTLAECSAWGRAWAAQVQAEQRENPTKFAKWECKKVLS
jgi:hypothetical protein